MSTTDEVVAITEQPTLPTPNGLTEIDKMHGCSPDNLRCSGAKVISYSAME